jgi:hypothetical protein
MRSSLLFALACSLVALGCSGAPSPTDAGSAVDARGTTHDASAPVDAAVVLDTSPGTGDGGGGCGTMTCTASQVCCAATGPGGGDQCAAPSVCAHIRCAHPSDCPSGLQCCTDGIQSTCADEADCFDRSCQTAADCLSGEVCCPFGDLQSTCRASC